MMKKGTALDTGDNKNRKSLNDVDATLGLDPEAIEEKRTFVENDNQPVQAVNG